MTTLPVPHFIDRDPKSIRDEIVGRVETLLGEALPPMSTERMLCELLAYRETLVRIQIQDACCQNLWAYARYPMIDHLAAMLNDGRIAAKYATATFRITLKEVRAVDSTVAAGTRIRSTDRRVFFALDTDVTIVAGQLTGETGGTAVATGSVSNGYLAGQVCELVSSLGFDASIANTTTTEGGAMSESTDAMRLRVPLKLATVSGAGPGSAYESLARNVSVDVIDASVVSPWGGAVMVTVLASYGTPTQELLDEVSAALSGDTVIPISDTPSVVGGLPTDVAVTVVVTLYQPKVPRTTQKVLDDVESAVAAWVAARGRKLGYQLPEGPLLKAVLAVAEVFEATVTSALPAIGAQRFARLSSCTVTLAGYTEEPLP